MSVRQHLSRSRRAPRTYQVGVRAEHRDDKRRGYCMSSTDDDWCGRTTRLAACAGRVREGGLSWHHGQRRKLHAVVPLLDLECLTDAL